MAACEQRGRRGRARVVRALHRNGDAHPAPSHRGAVATQGGHPSRRAATPFAAQAPGARLLAASSAGRALCSSRVPPLASRARCRGSAAPSRAGGPKRRLAWVRKEVSRRASQEYDMSSALHGALYAQSRVRGLQGLALPRVLRWSGPRLIGLNVVLLSFSVRLLRRLGERGRGPGLLFRRSHHRSVLRWLVEGLHRKLSLHLKSTFCFQLLFFSGLHDLHGKGGLPLKRLGKLSLQVGRVFLPLFDEQP